MKTTKQWWEDLKQNNTEFIMWLQKQYHGEVTAADRINKYCSDQAPEKWKPTLEKIKGQESQHADWVGTLLKNRGIEPKVLDKSERYWSETLKVVDNFESATAVAAHAEKMRLERIKVISEDKDAPRDVRQVFKKILKDELYHEKAFRRMAGAQAMIETQLAHINGTQAIGLIQVSEIL